MSEHKDREIVQKEIIASIKNNKLDLDELRLRLSYLAKYAAEETASEQTTSRAAAAAFEGSVEEATRYYNTIARQLLGLVPESEWQDRKPDKSLIASAWSSVRALITSEETPEIPYRTYKEFAAEHGLVAAKKPATYDPEKGLSAQGFEFAVGQKKQQEVGQFKKRAELFNVPAAKLHSAVINAVDMDSHGGPSIAAEEATEIQAEMRTLVALHKKNPGALPAYAKKSIESALQELKQHNVVASFPELKDEIVSLQTIVSAKPAQPSKAIQK